MDSERWVNAVDLKAGDRIRVCGQVETVAAVQVLTWQGRASQVEVVLVGAFQIPSVSPRARFLREDSP